MEQNYGGERPGLTEREGGNREGENRERERDRTERERDRERETREGETRDKIQFFLSIVNECYNLNRK